VVTMRSFPFAGQHTGDCDGTEQWFAVHVVPKLTRPILASLRQKDFEVFTPFRRTEGKALRGIGQGEKVPRIEAPLFPGYLFVRIDLRYRMPLLTTPGVHGIVGYGKQLIAIPDEEIEALKQVEASEFPTESWPFLRAGDTVRIIDGPLAGLEGILIGVKTATRIVVGVTLIQRALAVHLDLQSVRLERTSMPAPILSDSSVLVEQR
jgi:transcription antitermination factor NusG